MARPRLGEEERRTRTVGVRVTEAEAAELQERAQAALARGHPVCEFGRTSLFRRLGSHREGF